MIRNVMRVIPKKVGIMRKNLFSRYEVTGTVYSQRDPLSSFLKKMKKS